MGKDGRPPFMSLEEIRSKLKDGSLKIVCETSGVTKEVICKRCGTTHSPTFFLKNPKPTDGICPTCNTGKYLDWSVEEKKEDN